MITGKVKIKVTGWQTVGVENDTITVETEGTCTQVDEGYEIRYIEIPAEDMEVENIVVFSKEQARITKKGMIESEMIFIPGEKRMTAYKTPFGVIDMMVQCDSILVVEEESDPCVMISYSLYSGERIVSYCKTMIEICAAE